MAKPAQHREGSSRIRLRAVTGILSLVVVLGQALAAPQRASAQEPITYTLLYTFKLGTDGELPYGNLIRDAAGNFYGTTAGGGAAGAGTVFKVDATGVETVLYSFAGGSDGATPQGGLVRDSAGNLYGTTVTGGGTSGYGTVFKLDTTATETVLHRFAGGTDGWFPYGNLVRDAVGNLYGTTYYGGGLNCPNGCGTIFKVDTTGAETVLYSFTGTPDGEAPQAGLVRDAAGNLYGTTYYGGTTRLGHGVGTVFKLDVAGRESVLHRFAGGTDGQYPFAGLVLDTAGNLYGTTSTGGTTSCAIGCGTVFKLDPAGKETVLHRFTGADGAQPVAGSLVRDAVGNLYGTTSGGGTAGAGTVFKMDKTGNETVLYTFTGGADGLEPEGGLVPYAGALYGTTHGGGLDFGTVFKLV